MNSSTGGFWNERGRPGNRAAPLSLFSFCRRLADELVRAVRLDLEDVELRVQRIVGLRRPLELAAEDPVADLHLLDVPQHGLARRRPVTLLAGEGDRLQRHLRRA